MAYHHCFLSVYVQNRLVQKTKKKKEHTTEKSTVVWRRRYVATIDQAMRVLPSHNWLWNNDLDEHETIFIFLHACTSPPLATVQFVILVRNSYRRMISEGVCSTGGGSVLYQTPSLEYLFISSSPGGEGKGKKRKILGKQAGSERYRISFSYPSPEESGNLEPNQLQLGNLKFSKEFNYISVMIWSTCEIKIL